MTDEERQRVRTRDDGGLRRMIEEAGERLRAAGRASEPLDWDAVLREERAARWRDRLRAALAGLGALATGQAAGLPPALAESLRRLARAPETLAAAALELVVDSARQVARLRLEPALACMGPNARPEFAYSSARERRERGLAEESVESIGLLITEDLRGAKVIADASAGTLAVEFFRLTAPALVLLVPAAADQPVRVERAEVGMTPVRVVFAGVGAGERLVAVYASG